MADVARIYYLVAKCYKTRRGVRPWCVGGLAPLGLIGVYVVF